MCNDTQDAVVAQWGDCFHDLSPCALSIGELSLTRLHMVEVIGIYMTMAASTLESLIVMISGLTKG